VSYAGAKTGPIYLRVSSGCTGCSPETGTRIALTVGSGAYTIRGLQSGSYEVIAEMETPGTSTPNATNPAGVSASVIVAAANVTGVNIALLDPTPPAAVAPTGLQVFPSGGMAMIFWQPHEDANGAETASAYKIYWGTDPAASNGAPITVNAQSNGSYLQSDLTDGTGYYYKVSALVGATESAPSAVAGPITIGATTGANTVSGTVTFPGTATGPMLVAVIDYNNGNFKYCFTRIMNPVSPQSYSIFRCRER